MVGVRLLIILPILLGIVWQISFNYNTSIALLFGYHSTESGDADGLSLKNGTNILLEEGFCQRTIGEVDRDARKIAGLLNKITAHPYFRYFRVNLEKSCPYWEAQATCSCESRNCQVCTCDERNLPESLKYPFDMSDLSSANHHLLDGKRSLTGTEDEGSKESSDNDITYVDLIRNPEANTGYSGPMAARVWKAIYDENSGVGIPLKDGAGGTANHREKELFRRLLSGLHFSITMHVAAFFYNDTAGDSPLRALGVINNPNISFYPNCEMYKRISKNDAFVNNLYILYQFILRAVAKVKHGLLSDLDSFNSGLNGIATEEDKRLHGELRELLGGTFFQAPTFDETKFFETPDARLLVPRMMRMMHNITTLMDCVTCEKCRAWGKLETKGLATALNVVMHPSADKIVLNRGEKVTLINLARQLAISVQNVRDLSVVCENFSYVAKN
ncbi:unnamed protein product [Trypanosoma congolense IL3000]|uniref:WGS project CAEQ00000000 data, annotated contig 7 n=1 Tax=Trypanosoma congolense (strain IL3000) TaxID=1068625 RepID=F9WI16_TRYCI|nr:unnamed protein product [Trypanosoma congolense IL3000]